MGTRLVRRCHRVFEPLEANSPFLDVLPCMPTARKCIESGGDGDAVLGSGGVGGTYAVAVVGEKPLLTQHERVWTGDLLVGQSTRLADASEERGKDLASPVLWLLQGERAACHNKGPNRLTREVRRTGSRLAHRATTSLKNLARTTLPLCIDHH